jgi:O-antigen ligase
MRLAGYFTDNKNIGIHIFVFTIVMVLCALPFNITLSKIFIFASLFIWLLNPQRGVREFQRAYLKHVAIICSGFVALILGLVYTDNLSMGVHVIESKLTLIVFPVLIIFSKLKNEHIKFALACFTVSLIVASLWCLYKSYTIYFVSQNSSAFFNIEFVSPLQIHPNYFALYVSISILYLISVIRGCKGSVRALVLIALIFLFMINFLLLSRIMLLALSLSLILLVLLFFKGRLRYAYVVAFFVFFALIFFVGYNYVDSFQIRMKDALSLDNYSHEPVWSSSSGTHFKSWSCAIESLRSGKFIFGHGSGDEVDALLVCYGNHHWNAMIDQKLNSHNEYLSATMRCGVLGFATLLAMLFQSIYFAVKAKDIVLFGFICIIALFFTTGSLGMMHGVVFFGLVNAMLLKRCLEVV